MSVPFYQCTFAWTVFLPDVFVFMSHTWLTETSSYSFITFSWLTFRYFHFKLSKRSRALLYILLCCEITINKISPAAFEGDKSVLYWFSFGLMLLSEENIRWFVRVTKRSQKTLLNRTHLIQMNVSLSEHYPPGISLTTPMIPRCCMTSSVFDRLPSALITLLTVPLIRCSCHRSHWMSVWVLTSVSCPLSVPAIMARRSARGGSCTAPFPADILWWFVLTRLRRRERSASTRATGSKVRLMITWLCFVVHFFHGPNLDLQQSRCCSGVMAVMCDAAELEEVLTSFTEVYRMNVNALGSFLTPDQRERDRTGWWRTPNTEIKKQTKEKQEIKQQIMFCDENEALQGLNADAEFIFNAQQEWFCQ